MDRYRATARPLNTTSACIKTGSTSFISDTSSTSLGAVSGVPGIHVVCSLEDFCLWISSWSSAVSLWRTEILEQTQRQKHNHEEADDLFLNLPRWFCCLNRTTSRVGLSLDWRGKRSRRPVLLFTWEDVGQTVVSVQTWNWSSLKRTHLCLSWAARLWQVVRDFECDVEAARLRWAVLASSSLLCSALMTSSYSAFMVSRSLL